MTAEQPAPQTIVLIHGSNGSLHVWEGWARELGKEARVISVDLPGHGLTGAWPRDEYTVEAYADFIEVLIDTLHLDKVVVAGHSLGAAGVHEAIYCLLMMEQDFVTASANIENLDPGAEGMPIVRERIDDAGLVCAMSNSFGFGGTNASLVFKKYGA